MQRRAFLNAGLVGLGSTLVTGHPVPVQYIPKPSNEKWAILFGTWYGTARDASIWISEGMGGIAAVFDARQDPDLSPFDHIVVGSAIQNGVGPQVLLSFIEKNMAKIEGKVRGLFAVCGNLQKMPGPDNVRELIDDYLAIQCKAGPVPKQVFGGRVTKAIWSEADFKLVQELYVRLKMPPLQDYDNLRRPDCLKFGAEIRAAQA